MKKTLWLFCIAALFICITPLSVHAAEKEETIVQHTVEGSYVIKIPDCIEADAESLPLTISNVIIPYDHELAVTVDYDGELKLTEEQSVKLAYQLYADA